MTEDGDMLGWDESVFRDEHVLEIDYVPETFHHRDSQMESLKYALRPAVRGSRPLNVIARGPPGTGKTTAVQKLFGELRAETDVLVARVNCQVDATRYAVFSSLFEAVFDYEPPASGISFRELFEQITDHLVEEDAVLAVALDDVNYLAYENEISETLYSLLRAHESQTGARIGVIVISSDTDLELLDAVDERVQSVFRPEEVFFPPYDQPEIVDILDERVERGFQPDAVGPTVLDRVAELTADHDGDLRMGIDLLRRAGLNAEMAGRRTVASEDVDAAYETAKHVQLSRDVNALSDTERDLLGVIASEGGGHAGDVFEAFNDQTGLAYTRYAEVLNKLERVGLIDTQYTSVEGRGRTRMIELAYDADAVAERL
ncbi:ORC1-type DNA replication protein [Halococcoides cellulosivorans]|uniref:ORC1-type DNA replication protein n=1 Tax=Halococcoides cellulosivorans TaxID=1679096 RepID=A0A2R4WZ05_9EURY|nr:ORC1-type DNA replication protein [Halococcoides cellulosivorans]AWB26778.1 cell division control protein 6 [Halococcoides cellulosivorans]